MSVISDKGTVLKVISVPKESWNNMEELLLEELEVFKVSIFENIYIFIEKSALYDRLIRI